MREARPNARHRRATHERWVLQLNRRQGSTDYRDEWYREQCGMCEFWVPLAGQWGLDYGACSNPSSPFDGRVRFEHDGCDAYSEGGRWGGPQDFVLKPSVEESPD